MHTRLRAEREHLGLTQKQVARMCGDMNHSTVSLWESGQRRPRPHAARRLVAIFDRPLDDLLTNEDGTAPLHKDGPVDSTSGPAKDSEFCHAV